MEEEENPLARAQFAWAQYQTALDALVAYLCSRTGCSEGQAREAIDAHGIDVGVETLIAHIESEKEPSERPG
ncbi:hypothetical protein D9M72_301390 [compost metagenome]